MIKEYKFKFNLLQLEEFAQSLSKRIVLSDVIFLKGDLGSGKTTLARFLIKHCFLLNKIQPPKIIPSPTFTILQKYEINNFSIYHYDFFRINNINEIFEMGFEENFANNISLVEWPEKIFSMISKKNLIVIELIIINKKTRKLIMNSNKKQILS